LGTRREQSGCAAYGSIAESSQSTAAERQVGSGPHFASDTAGVEVGVDSTRGSQVRTERREAEVLLMAYIVAIHDISDPDRFWGAADPAAIPPQVTLHATYPRGDGSRAVCLWEADSVDTVRDLIESVAGDSSRNEFFEADPQHMGARGLSPAARVQA
jgi:hypothetical protein